MMISSKQLTHFSIHATDGDIGGIRDVLFDDKSYVVRYLVADTNIWLPLSKKVVVSPISVKQVEIESDIVNIDMTVKTLKESPTIEEHKPVSREYEEHLFKYFGYGYYWIGPGAWGEFAHPNELADQPQSTDNEGENISENHLRACSEVSGYEVATQDGNVGHISQFIIDITRWTIVMLVVDTNNWLPGGKHLALLPNDIIDIDWAAHHVSVKLTHEELINRPDIDEQNIPITGYINEICAAINE